MRCTELTTLAPILSSLRRMVEGTAVARRCFQGDAADAVDEDIGEGGEDQAHLVGLVGVCAHAVGEQVELAVLDAVFHVAARAIDVFLEFPGRDLMAIQRGDEEAGSAVGIRACVRLWR